MYTVEFSVIKKNGTMTFSAKWTDRENITARETKEARSFVSFIFADFSSHL